MLSKKFFDEHSVNILIGMAFIVFIGLIAMKMSDVWECRGMKCPEGQTSIFIAGECICATRAVNELPIQLAH